MDHQAGYLHEPSTFGLRLQKEEASFKTNTTDQTFIYLKQKNKTKQNKNKTKKVLKVISPQIVLSYSLDNEVSVKQT